MVTWPVVLCFWSVVEDSFSERWQSGCLSVCHVWQHASEGHRPGHQGNRGGQEQELRRGVEVDQDYHDHDLKIHSIQAI